MGSSSFFHLKFVNSKAMLRNFISPSIIRPLTATKSVRAFSTSIAHKRKKILSALEIKETQ